MTVWSLGFERVTVNVKAVVPLLPSVTDTSAIEMTGCGSSFMIVPVAPSVPQTWRWPGRSGSRVKVSLGSSVVSPLTGTVTVWLVTPGVKVSVPLRWRA